MEVTPQDLLPTPVEFTLDGKKLVLKSLSLGVEVWANEYFANNEALDNGLEVMAARLAEIHLPTVARLAWHLLTDQSDFADLKAFAKKVHTEEGAGATLKALDECVRKSWPEIERGLSGEPRLMKPSSRATPIQKGQRPSITGEGQRHLC